MIIVLNGPLGIGKSTLAEALAESIDECVMLNGDRLVAANPPPANEIEYFARALDEQEFELRTVTEEREALSKSGRGDLGEPFDVSAPPPDLVAALMRYLRLR